jgi:hypothetical protein
MLMIIWGLVVSSYVVMDARRGVEVYMRHVLEHFVPGTVSIVYVAANQTSQEIFCKLRNDGPNSATLTELWVNNTRVNTGNSLPLAFEPLLDYKTFVFNYNGSWQGSILITFYTPWSQQPFGDNGVQKLVYLKAVSANPISEAYTSEMDLLNLLLVHGDIFEWSKSIFILGLAIIVPLLILRSRRPILHFPTPLGGVIVASSLIFSIIVAVVTLAFPEPFRLPVTIQATLLVLVPYVAGSALIVGSALVVIVLRYLAEYYHDWRMLAYAVAGLVCMIICVVAAAVSTNAAYDLGSSFGNYELHVVPLAPIVPPLVMRVQGSGIFISTFLYDLLAARALLSLLFSTLFFILSLNRLSTKANIKRFKIVISRLTIGTFLVSIFSMGIFGMIPAWNSGAGDLLVVDFVFAAFVLEGVVLLSIVWLFLTTVFYSIQPEHATQFSPTDKSGNAQGLQALVK